MDFLKKQTVFQLITVLCAFILVFAAYSHIVGSGTIFKGSMEGSTIKAKVIRVTDVNRNNLTGDNEYVTVHFKALALNTELRGKTLDVIQDIDKSYAFSPGEVEEGDRILIEAYTENNVTSYYFGDYVRITTLVVLGLVFCALVIIFSGIQGVKTLVSLGLTCLSVFIVLIPAILNGLNIYFWAVLTCIFITVVTLIVISGYNVKTFCACTGCMCGVVCAGLIAVLMDRFLNMTGLLEEESVYLVQLYPDNPINLKAIIFAMIIVGAVGAIMDVSMSVSSSLYELRSKSRNISSSELIKSGFTIGRDMMGTMANTLVLAYIGSSLTCVLLMVSYNANLNQVINKEVIIEEILQALAGSLGMLLTLPLTSVICGVLYYRKVKPDASGKDEQSAQ